MASVLADDTVPARTLVICWHLCLPYAALNAELSKAAHPVPERQWMVQYINAGVLVAILVVLVARSR